MLLTTHFARVKDKVKCLREAVSCSLNRAGIVLNIKQKAWRMALSALNRDDLVVLETGRIRNPQWVLTDGNSTDYFSRLTRVKKLISIDNDSENFSGFSSSEAYCRQYLRPRQLWKISFVNGDSRIMITKLPIDTIIDVVLLDSANDPNVIFDELKSVMPYLTRRPAVVIIDDVSGGGKKGDKAVPYLESLNYEKHLVQAQPSDCAFFVLT